MSVYITLKHVARRLITTQNGNAEQLMRSLATAVTDSAITDFVAEKALNVSAEVVANMKEATRSGQTSDILAATIDVYRGVTEYMNSQTGANSTEQNKPARASVQQLKRDLKARAGQFCDALTRDSAPDAAPLGSASTDFLFSCQKVAERRSRSADVDNSMQVYGFAYHVLMHAPWPISVGVVHVSRSLWLVKM